MSQMNPKEAFHNTAYSVQLPYIAGLSHQKYFIIEIISKTFLTATEKFKLTLELTKGFTMIKYFIFSYKNLPFFELHPMKAI